MTFVKVYFSKESTQAQFLYLWVRIFDFLLSVILAGILNIATNNRRIWEAKWVEGRLAETHNLKYISFFKKNSTQLESTKGTEESSESFEIALALRENENDLNMIHEENTKFSVGNI